jgi:hypothetical protein
MGFARSAVQDFERETILHGETHPSSELCITHKFSNRSPSNPVGIKGNEAVPQIANLWVMHSSEEGNRIGAKAAL